MADRGYFDLLKWSYECGFPLSYHIERAAIVVGSVEMLEWFITELAEYAPKPFSLFSECAAFGNVNIFDWLIEKYGYPKKYAKIICGAAEHGHMDIVKKFPKTQIKYTDVFKHLLIGGHLELAKEIYECEIVGKIDMDVAVIIREDLKSIDFKNNIHVLEWLVSEGLLGSGDFSYSCRYPEMLKWLWSMKFIDHTEEVYCDIASNAAERGNLEIIKWVYSLTGAYVIRKSGAPDIVFRKCHIKIIHWMESVGIDIITTGNVCTQRTFEQIKWLVERFGANSKRFIGQEHYLCAAAGEGRLEVFDWVYEVRQDIFNEPNHILNICFGAAWHNKKCVLKWLLKHGYRLQKGTHVRAICSGNVKLCQWLIARDPDQFSISHPKLCENAIYWDRLGSLKWLRSQGCEWNCEIFHKDNKLSTTELWAIENGCPITDTKKIDRPSMD